MGCLQGGRFLSLLRGWIDFNGETQQRGEMPDLSSKGKVRSTEAGGFGSCRGKKQDWPTNMPNLGWSTGKKREERTPTGSKMTNFS